MVSGRASFYATHITASVFIKHDVSGLHEDYKKWLEDLAPFDASPQRYSHNRTGEDNADAHMKRQIMGREVVVAISNGKLDFGPWEQIFYGEFDGRRPKRVLVKVIGELESGMNFVGLGDFELSRISTIKLDWREARCRPQLIVGAFVIDDWCLLEHCERASKQTYDLVSPIGWTIPQYQVEFAERLLLRIPAELPSGRRELLVCPECGDVGCGCISANVSSEGDYFVWDEIGHENNYDPESLTIFPMGRFVFPKDELLNQFQSHIAGIC